VNSYRTFRQLMQLGIIPVVNENDTVATDELKFGDNDTLSALVAGIVEADWLILLTDVDRLYSADPRLDPNAQPIVRVEKGKPLLVQAGSTGASGWGTGGMATKLSAAQIATSMGVTMAIANGKSPHLIPNILAGEDIGTRFDPDPQPSNARKRWIAFVLQPKGSIVLDTGAVKAVYEQGRSLLPAGIASLTGNFEAGAAVSLRDESDREIARGLSNYSSVELERIRGKNSRDIEKTLGYSGEDTVVHRDNLMLLELEPFVG
ncbi:MAG: glutamate 5-kinase, partial [Cyanobacteria bacterium J06555_12]